MIYIQIAIAVIVTVSAIIFYKRKKREQGMPQGLQIFDENGNLTFDLSTNTTQVLGSASTGGTDGSIQDSSITPRCWVLVTDTADANTMIPLFTATNGQLSWTYHDPYLYSRKGNVNFIYGGY